MPISREREIISVLLLVAIAFFFTVSNEVSNDTCLDNTIRCACCADTFEYVSQRTIRDKLLKMCSNATLMRVPKDCAFSSQRLRIAWLTSLALILFWSCRLTYLQKYFPGPEKEMQIYCVFLIFFTFFCSVITNNPVTLNCRDNHNATCVAYDTLAFSS